VWPIDALRLRGYSVAGRIVDWADPGALLLGLVFLCEASLP
jgi:hypothetical protein